MDVFLRQNEAWRYVKSIEDAKERLLSEIAVAKALSFLATDPEYRAHFCGGPARSSRLCTNGPRALPAS